MWICDAEADLSSESVVSSDSFEGSRFTPRVESVVHERHRTGGSKRKRHEGGTPRVTWGASEKSESEKAKKREKVQAPYGTCNGPNPAWNWLSWAGLGRAWGGFWKSWPTARRVAGRGSSGDTEYGVQKRRSRRRRSESDLDVGWTYGRNNDDDGIISDVLYAVMQ